MHMFWQIKIRNHLNGLLNFSINTSTDVLTVCHADVNLTATDQVGREEGSVFIKPNPTRFLAANHSDCANFLSRSDLGCSCGF